MEWIQVGTLAITLFTLIKSFYDSHIKQKQIKKDRHISVVVNEQRRMQRELMEHVTKILFIDRKVTIGRLKREEMRNDANDVQNHKINIWINLNRENKYQKELRSECNHLATFLSGLLENPNDTQYKEYTLTSSPIKQKIWVLIDKYVEEEEILIQKLLD